MASEAAANETHALGNLDIEGVEMEGDSGLGVRMDKALVKGVLIGLPVAYVGLVVGLLLITDRDLVQSIETAVLPGLMMGVFFGGFFGLALMLLDIEREEKRARSGSRNRK